MVKLAKFNMKLLKTMQVLALILDVSLVQKKKSQDNYSELTEIDKKGKKLKQH